MNRFELDIEEFMVKFGMDYEGEPRHLPSDIENLRIELIKEELREYLRAVESGSLEEEFDALIDLVYVALGNAHLHGFPFSAGWERVHGANMRKVRGVSKRGHEFDVTKPPGWEPPNLWDLLYEEEDEPTSTQVAEGADASEPEGDDDDREDDDGE